MKCTRILRHAALLMGGVGMLFQMGCTTTQFFDFVSTVFLGITAAGSIAIIQNI
ncbi:MAG: hypothetical protein KAV82_09480 [Phycisphaerae bacterium]|nr:hypothetical protein [Phycisphaerae bacterium]